MFNCSWNNGKAKQNMLTVFETMIKHNFLCMLHVLNHHEPLRDVKCNVNKFHWFEIMTKQTKQMFNVLTQ